MPEKKSSNILFKGNSRHGQGRYSVSALERASSRTSIGERRKTSWSDVSLTNLDDDFIYSKGKLILLNFAWLGIMIAMIVLVVAAVPSQVSFLVGSRRKAHGVALVAIVGSCAVFISAPLFGYLSDNSRSRFGRRRVFMVAGTFVACIGLLGAALCAPHFSNDKDLLPKIPLKNLTSSGPCTTPKPKCPSNATTDAGTSGHGTDVEFGLFALSVVTYFFGSTILSTALAGLIADKTHPAARGVSSGIVGGMMLSGNLLGAGLGILADHLHVSGTYAATACVLCLGVSITCIFTPERPANHSKVQFMSLKDLIYGYGRPFKSHDFRWVVITRFLLQMGLATCVGFLQFWLDDVIPLPGCIMPIQAVSILFIPLMIMGAISSAVCGVWTDRLCRRKIFVYVAGCGMALSSIGLIFCRSYWLALCLVSLIGIAYGAYVSVDLALVMDVLPDPKEHAKDLAVWHQSMVLPQLIATPIGGFLVQSFQSLHVGEHSRPGCEYGLGYKVLFGVTALYLFASAILVRKITAVR